MDIPLINNGRFQETANELMPITQRLNFGYSEVNYANATKIFEKNYSH
jgi:hypothetical protein